MSSIRVVSKSEKKGVYKVIVLHLDKEIKMGIGYNIDKKLEASLLCTFDKLESTIIRGDEINCHSQRRTSQIRRIGGQLVV